MAKKLYALRNVPEDEAEEMRAVLRENNIGFHETDAGFLGIGTAALWVNNETQLEMAQMLIKAYQVERFEKARTTYAQKTSAGEQTRFIDLLKQRPGKVIVYLLLAAFLILLTAGPFWFS